MPADFVSRAAALCGAAHYKFVGSSYFGPITANDVTPPRLTSKSSC